MGGKGEKREKGKRGKELVLETLLYSTFPPPFDDGVVDDEEEGGGRMTPMDGWMDGWMDGRLEGAFMRIKPRSSRIDKSSRSDTRSLK